MTVCPYLSSDLLTSPTPPDQPPLTGLAASVILALPTILSTAIAVPLGLAFDGSPGPLALGAFVCVGLALCAMPLLGPRANAGPANPP